MKGKEPTHASDKGRQIKRRKHKAGGGVVVKNGGDFEGDSLTAGA